MKEMTGTTPEFLRKAKFGVVAIVVLATASGCTSRIPSINGPSTARMPHQTYPIEVAKTKEELSFVYAPHMFALRQDDKDMIANFVAAYKAEGHGALTIVAPTGSPNEPAAISAAADMSQVMVANGVSPRDVDVKAYYAPETADRAPIYVRYTKYKATTPECKRPTQNFAFNVSNVSSPGFGCAYQHNLATMVADPKDFLSPKELGAGDPARRATVFDKYRKGEPTATQRDKQQESAAISVINK